MRNFLLGCMVGAAGLYGSMCFHIVRAQDGYHFIPKSALTFTDTYVDIREFGLADWQQHVTLAEALLKSDRADLAQDAATEAVSRSVQQTFEKMLPRR